MRQDGDHLRMPNDMRVNLPVIAEEKVNPNKVDPIPIKIDFH